MHTCLALICIFFANKWTTGLKRKEAELFLLHMLSYGGPAVAERSWLCAHRLIAENIASRKQQSQRALAQNYLHICKWSGTTPILCRCFIAPCSKIRSFESNYAVLMKVLACRWGYSAPPSGSAGGALYPFAILGTALDADLANLFSRLSQACTNLWLIGQWLPDSRFSWVANVLFVCCWICLRGGCSGE